MIGKWNLSVMRNLWFAMTRTGMAGYCLDVKYMTIGLSPHLDTEGYIGLIQTNSIRSLVTISFINSGEHNTESEA